MQQTGRDMIETNILKEIEAFAQKGALVYDEPLCNHTTFRVGGKADAFLSANSKETLLRAIKVCHENQVPYYVLGNGSNVLVSDKGYRGLIISIGREMARMECNENLITVQAGAMLSSVARMAAKNELTGMEFASGIPGSIGGAIVMNAGAYDGEMKQIVDTVEILEKDGRIRVFSADEMEFGYRTSRIKTKGGIVLSVTLRLMKGNKEAILGKMNELAGKRREKQPLEYPSAGSTFKRPEGYFAGKLIMDAGLRGYTVGGAQVSEKHCGFVINKDGATGKDIYTLIGDVQKKVKEASGIVLEPEVIFLGDFG